MDQTPTKHYSHSSGHSKNHQETTMTRTTKNRHKNHKTPAIRTTRKHTTCWSPHWSPHRSPPRRSHAIMPFASPPSQSQLRHQVDLHADQSNPTPVASFEWEKEREWGLKATERTREMREMWETKRQRAGERINKLKTIQPCFSIVRESLRKWMRVMRVSRVWGERELEINKIL